MFWYGKKPSEQAVLELFVKGPYLYLFITIFILVFILPWFTMIWNPVRRSIWGPPILAASVLLGTLLDRIRLYVASWDVAGKNMVSQLEMKMSEVPTKIPAPEIADIFIMVGFIGGSILTFMLATRLIPAINLWEQKEMLLYKAEVQFHRTKVTIMGKSR